VPQLSKMKEKHCLVFIDRANNLLHISDKAD